MIESKTFALAVRKARKEQGMTQKEAASHCQVSYASYQRIELGAPVGMEICSAVAAALNINLLDSANEVDCAVMTRLASDRDDLSAIFYPVLTGHKDMKVTNIGQMLIYLPLMDPEALVDALCRIDALVPGYEQYILALLSRLCAAIPDGPAKKYADFMSQISSFGRRPSFDVEIEFWRQYQDPEMEACHKAYQEHLRKWQSQIKKDSTVD